MLVEHTFKARINAFIQLLESHVGGDEDYDHENSGDQGLPHGGLLELESADGLWPAYFESFWALVRLRNFGILQEPPSRKIVGEGDMSMG